MIVLPDIRTYLNSYIDSDSNNVLLVFPNPRLKTIYKMYCFPKPNEILFCFMNNNCLSKKLDGIRFKEYKFMSFHEVEKLRQESFKRFEKEILNGTSKKEPRGLFDTLKKKSKLVKYKPRNKKRNYTGLQNNHVIVDEVHEWRNKND